MSKDLNAAIAVDIVVLAGQDPEVLLIQRRDGQWALPGGFVDDGETFHAAAVRELHEETAVRLVELRRIDLYDAPDRDPRMRVVSVAFLAHLPTRPAAVAGDDARAVRWVPVRSVRETVGRLAFDHDLVLRDALRLAGVR